MGINTKFSAWAARAVFDLCLVMLAVQPLRTLFFRVNTRDQALIAVRQE